MAVEFCCLSFFQRWSRGRISFIMIIIVINYYYLLSSAEMAWAPFFPAFLDFLDFGLSSVVLKFLTNSEVTRESQWVWTWTLKLAPGILHSRADILLSGWDQCGIDDLSTNSSNIICYLLYESRVISMLLILHDYLLTILCMQCLTIYSYLLSRMDVYKLNV